MFPRSARAGTPRLLVPLLPLALGVLLSGCVGKGDAARSRTGMETLSASSAPGGARKVAEQWGERYARNKGDRTTALNYAAALTAAGQEGTAVAVLQQAAMRQPNDKVITAAYGKALVRAGRFEQAVRVLEQTNSREQLDWQILSAQGAALDQMGRHADAQRVYAAALKIAPDEPRVLSNLGLSQALAGQLREAEATLRRAGTQPKADTRVRQNLALVVGLQGRFGEAEEIARKDLSPEDAAANVAYLRHMLAQPNKWKQLRGLDKDRRGAPEKKPDAPAD